MQTREYTEYLKELEDSGVNFKKLSIKDHITYCIVAEEMYSDLDTEFKKDKGESLLVTIASDYGRFSYMNQLVSCYFDFLEYFGTDALQINDIEINTLSNQIFEIENLSSLSSEQKLTLINNLFDLVQYRTKLKNLWGGCSVSGYNSTKLLIVTRIKPYNECNSIEKFDIYNGLLLTPNYIKLFEACLISFDTLGSIMINDSLTDTDLLQLGISRNDNLKNEYLTLNHGYYLEHHRNRFLGELAIY